MTPFEINLFFLDCKFSERIWTFNFFVLKYILIPFYFVVVYNLFIYIRDPAVQLSQENVIRIF